MFIRLAACVPLLLAGCAPLPDLVGTSGYTAAADPASALPAPAGPSVSYQSSGVVDPADWRSLNDLQRRPGS
jgi:hypothetical protein